MLKKLAAIISMAAAALGAGISLAQPAAAESDAPRRCVVVLGKFDPAANASKIVAQKCSTNEKELASITPQAESLLLRAYEHIAWGGGTASYYGQYGTCDWEGYRIPHAGILLGRVSSFTVHGSCNYTTAYTGLYETGDYESYRSNAWYVGDFMNDRISSFRVVYRP